MRLRQLGHPQAALPQRLEHAAARGIRERAEDAIEDGILILNHKVKY